MLDLSEQFVVESNALIRGKYAMSLTEIRIFLSVLAQVDQSDEDVTYYKVHVRDLLDLIGKKRKDLHASVRDAARSLQEKTVEITEGKTHKFRSVFYGINYKEDEGYISAAFHPDLKPFVYQLRANFTQYDLRNVLPLSSSHAIRMYRILKSSLYQKTVVYSVDDLKAMLGLSKKYPLYGGFKRDVIDKAQNDLAKYTDLQFTYEVEKKEGRKVTHLRFHIFEQEPERDKEAMPAIDIFPDAIWQQHADAAEAIFAVHGLSSNQKTRVFNFCGNDAKYIHLKAQEVSARMKKRGKPFANPAAYLAKAIRGDYNKEEVARLYAVWESQQQKEAKQQHQTQKAKLEEELQVTFDTEKRALLAALDIDHGAVYQLFLQEAKESGTYTSFVLEKLEKLDGVSVYDDKLGISFFNAYLVKTYLDPEWQSFEAWQEKQAV